MPMSYRAWFTSFLINAALFVAASPHPSYADSTVHYIISTGQSLSVGAAGRPCLSLTQPAVGATGWVSHAQGSFPGYNLMYLRTPESVIDYTACRPTFHSTELGTIAVSLSGTVMGTGTAWDTTFDRGILVAGGREFVFTYVSATSGRVTPLPTSALAPGTKYRLSKAASEEAHTMGLANQLTQLHPQKDWVSMPSLHGVLGTAYAGLKKGSSPYANSLTSLTNARSFVTANDPATARPRPFVVSAVDVVHGEADFVQGASAAQYAAYLLEWIRDYNADIRSLTGQTAPVPLVTDQMNTWGNYRTTPTTATNCAGYPSGGCPSVPIGQWWAARDHSNEIFLVGPKYQYRYADGLHLSNHAYRHLGEMHAKAMAKVLQQGQKWLPLSPRSVSRSGSVVTATFYVPVGCLQFDATRNDAAIQQFSKLHEGFEYFDTSNSAAISSVRISSCDQVTITLDRVPTGANQRLRYAYTAGGRGGTAAAARGTLADTDPAVGLDGLSLRDYAIAFDEPISSGTSPCDVNGDGRTSASDVQLAINQALGAPCTADVNRDGRCSGSDCQLVINAALGLGCASR
jgi:hypothetical protein